MGLWREMLIEDIPYVYNIATDIWTTHKESQIIYENKERSDIINSYLDLIKHNKFISH